MKIHTTPASAVKENCMRAHGWIRNPPCDPMWTLC
jgi:hypothetical protein